MTELSRRVGAVSGWAVLRAISLIVLAGVLVVQAAQSTAVALLPIPILLGVSYVLFVVAGRVARLTAFGRILGLLTFGVLTPIGLLLGFLALAFGLVGVLVMVVALGDAAAAVTLYDAADEFSGERPSEYEIEQRLEQPDETVPGVPDDAEGNE